MIILIGTLGDSQANYKAIIQSEKLSNCRKNDLLRNVLTDIEFVFFGTLDKDQVLIQQQEEAKQLYNDIRMNFLVC
ncbi:MAG: hypothetical protein WBA84_05215 [Carnobacterium sp.]|uniref:hypothetical protein n=1 Tax=Carnobacterium sp. TaxID=48221 RepID=UPI003C73A124